MERPDGLEDISLTVRDRMNYMYLLMNQIITFQKSILNTEFSEREIEESILGLANLIPDIYRDDEFKKEYDEAVTKEMKDIRPKWGGRKLSMKFCENRKIQTHKEVPKIYVFKLLKGCMNLFSRLGMLTRREWTEKPTGMPFDEDIEDLDQFSESLENDELEGDKINGNN